MEKNEVKRKVTRSRCRRTPITFHKYNTDVIFDNYPNSDYLTVQPAVAADPNGDPPLVRRFCGTHLQRSSFVALYSDVEIRFISDHMARRRGASVQVLGVEIARIGSYCREHSHCQALGDRMWCVNERCNATGE